MYPHCDAALKKAKVGLLLHQPFFATFLLNTETHYSSEIEKICLSPSKLTINPEWIAQATPIDIKRHLLLASLHLSLRHIQRRKDRNPQTWNAACEYASTPLVLDSGFPLPETWLYDTQYTSMNAETVYLLLEQAKRQAQETYGRPRIETTPAGSSEEQNQNQGRDQGEENTKNENGTETETANEDENEGNDFRDDWNTGNEDEGEERSEYVAPSAAGVQFSNEPLKDTDPAEQAVADSAVSIALSLAQAQGNLPNGFRRRMEKRETAKQDWREILWNRFDERNTDDFSMRRPSKRFLEEPFYLPSLSAPALPEIAIIVDTSGSIDQPTLDMFLAEVNSILTTFNPPKVHYLASDTKVHLYQEFTEYPIQPEFPGGGGTNLQAPYHYMRAHGINPGLVLHWTDMLSVRWPKTEDTDADILWCATSMGFADAYKPIGEIVPLWPRL